MAAGAGTDGSEEWVAGDGTTDCGTTWSGRQRCCRGRTGGSCKRTEKQEQEKKTKVLLLAAVDGWEEKQGSHIRDAAQLIGSLIMLSSETLPLKTRL